MPYNASAPYTLHPNFLFLLLTNAATLHSFEKKKKLSLIFKYFCRHAVPYFCFKKNCLLYLYII